jgi:hypothetical protein
MGQMPVFWLVAMLQLLALYSGTALVQSEEMWWDSNELGSNVMNQ